MFCGECGRSELAKTAIQCPDCGHPTGTSTQVTTPPSTGMLAVGWLGAFFFPIIGIIMGIIVITKKDTSAGVGMLVVSCLSWIFWAAVLAGM